MKHTVVLALALVCLALGRPARAAEPDPWWGKDKALHFSLSIGLGSGGYAGSALLAPERWQRAAAGAGFSLTLGAGKELFDLAGHGDPSWRDFSWDVAGTALGVGVAYLLDLALSPRAVAERRSEHRSHAGSGPCHALAGSYGPVGTPCQATQSSRTEPPTKADAPGP
jgi:putative lipoprotein